MHGLPIIVMREFPVDDDAPITDIDFVSCVHATDVVMEGEVTLTLCQGGNDEMVWGDPGYEIQLTPEVAAELGRQLIVAAATEVSQR